MGLDVYKMMVVEESEHFFDLFEYEENKSMKALFNHFKNYAKDAVVEVDDWEKTFSDMGMHCEDWEWVSSTFDGESMKVTFHNPETKDVVKVNFEDVATKRVNVKRLFYTETAYQRKQMKTEFYTEFLSGCWYVSEDTQNEVEDSPDYVFTQQELNRAKSYATIGAPIVDWNLKDNEFVYFSY